MAKTSVKVGLKALYLSPVGEDGGMGTDFDQLPFNIEGVPVLTTEEGEQTDFPVEESDTPYYSIKNQGNQILTTSVYGINAEMLQKHFGGTYTPGGTSADPDVWEAPAQIPDKEVSVRLVHKNGGYLDIVRAKLSVILQWKFQKAGLPQLDFSFTVLTPTKPNTGPLKFYDDGVYTP